MIGGPPPPTAGALAVGVVAGWLAILNWGVLAAALGMSLVMARVPGLHRLLLGAGAAGYVAAALVLASALFVWLVALHHVHRDAGLSPRAWNRWTVALLVLNLFAGSAYMALWLRRYRRSARGGPLPQGEVLG